MVCLCFPVFEASIGMEKMVRLDTQYVYFNHMVVQERQLEASCGLCFVSPRLSYKQRLPVQQKTILRTFFYLILLAEAVIAQRQGLRK